MEWNVEWRWWVGPVVSILFLCMLYRSCYHLSFLYRGYLCIYVSIILALYYCRFYSHHDAAKLQFIRLGIASDELSWAQTCDCSRPNTVHVSHEYNSYVFLLANNLVTPEFRPNYAQCGIHLKTRIPSNHVY